MERKKYERENIRWNGKVCRWNRIVNYDGKQRNGTLRSLH